MSPHILLFLIITTGCSSRNSFLLPGSFPEFTDEFRLIFYDHFPFRVLSGEQTPNCFDSITQDKNSWIIPDTLLSISRESGWSLLSSSASRNSLFLPGSLGLPAHPNRKVCPEFKVQGIEGLYFCPRTGNVCGGSVWKGRSKLFLFPQEKFPSMK